MAAARDHWPILVLSLEGDEARRAPLLGSLAAMGLEAEVLIGVDGRAGLPEWAEAEVDRARAVRYGRAMTDGELACALSHRRAYRRIVERGLPGALILEDDAIVEETFARFTEARGYDAGEIVVLGHRKTWVRRGTAAELAPGLGARRLVATPIGAYGYSLSARGARHLIDHATPVRAPADWPCDISRLTALASEAQIVTHPEELDGQSHLDRGRRGKTRQRGRHARFLRRDYWAGWWRKRLGRRIA